MGEIRTISGRSLLALICSLLLAIEPLSAASPTGVTAGADSSGGTRTSDSIAVAKLTGTAERNGQPLINGSIVTSGDILSTHGDSALLLSSTPQERLWLGPNTSAKITKDAGNVAVALGQGTLTFQTRGHIQVIFENHDGLMIRSRPDTSALAQLSFLNNEEAQVRVQEGTLELVQNGHSVLLEPENSGSSSASGPHQAGQQAKSTELAGTGSLDGTVVDQKLFAVPGASVSLTDSAGKTLKTQSNHEGKFSFRNVTPGSYTLLVTQAGFQNYQLPNVAVRAGNSSSLYVKLGGTGVAKKDNHILIWVLVGAGIAGGIGAAVAAKGSSSSSSVSQSSTQ